MLLAIATAFILVGAFFLFRARGFIHWRRGYRDMTRFQRTWMAQHEKVRALRMRGAILLAMGLGVAAILLHTGQNAPAVLAFAWAP